MLQVIKFLDTKIFQIGNGIVRFGYNGHIWTSSGGHYIKMAIVSHFGGVGVLIVGAIRVCQ